jgi:hypothetical protein
MVDLPNPDKLLANATHFLVQGQEFYEASILLLSQIEVEFAESDDRWGPTELDICFISDRAIFDIITDNDNPHVQNIKKAFNVALPPYMAVSILYGRVEYVNYNSNWRQEMLEIIEGKRPLNQCTPIQDKPRFPWENLFFRSPVEVSIAKSLDKTGVLFLPNCMARLGTPGSRENREADFLVCCEGKWGILEIDGETFHTSAAKDHDRSRLFKRHNIRVFENYSAKRCTNDPDKVVKEFLEILRRNG